MTTTNIHLITNGVVRNLLKTTYYLRIPADPYRKDRVGKKVAIPSTQDVEIDYRDWKLVEYDLITKDRLNILRIIRYPEAAPMPSGGMTVITSWTQLPANPPPGMLVWVQYGPYQGIYHWDETRGEWLSENEMIHTWNSASSVSDASVGLLHHTNDLHADNDVACSIPLTVTGMAASQVNPLAPGNATRFALGCLDLGTGAMDTDIAHVDLDSEGERGAGSTTLKANVPAGAVLSASRLKLSGADKIVRPALTMWYRWRLEP